MVTIPLRAIPAFGATLKVTVPLPAPVGPEEIAIQLTLLAAVQLQFWALETVTELVPPLDPVLKLGAESVNEQAVPGVMVSATADVILKSPVAADRKYWPGMPVKVTSQVAIPLESLNTGPVQTAGEGPAVLRKSTRCRPTFEMGNPC